MATGDDAAAAGMDLVSGSTLANTLDDEVNLTRDYIAQRTSAVQPVAKGGTGSTTTSGARNNLGIIAANVPSGSPINSTVQADLTYLGAQLGGKAPISHGHTIDQVTSLQSILDALYLGQLSSAVYSRNITSTRRAVWISDAGVLGYASSRRADKQDIEEAGFTEEQLRGIPVVHYRYKVEAEKGSLVREIGTIADDLDSLALGDFVMYDDDGKPLGVHYELLSLAALALAQSLADRLDDLEARMTALESS